MKKSGILFAATILSVSLPLAKSQRNGIGNPGFMSYNTGGLIKISKSGSNEDISFLKGLEFKGKELGDSKTFYSDGIRYIAKADGGVVAELHDEIARSFGLMSKEVPILQKIFIPVVPSSDSPWNSYPKITQLIGQMREFVHIKETSKEERETFIKKNIEGLVKASMLGVGITDIVGNKRNIVKINDETSLIDVDPTSLPIIPSLKRFIKDDEIKEIALKFISSPEYEMFKNKKMNKIEEYCGKDSEFYRQHSNSFQEIENYLNGVTPTYQPTNVYFGNTRDVRKDSDEFIFFQNIQLLSRDDNRTEKSSPFERESKFNPNIGGKAPNLLLASAQAKKLSVNTKEL